MPDAIVFTAIPSYSNTIDKSDTDSADNSDTDSADEEGELPITIPALLDSVDDSSTSSLLAVAARMDLHLCLYLHCK
jgi:hypothetical protein